MPRLPNVLCVTDLSMVPDTLRWLQKEVELNYRPGMRSGVADIIGGYEAFWGHVDLKLDKHFFDRGVHLKVINTASTGTDHIDVVEARQRGIKILSITRDYGLLNRFSATAECAWMLLLNCYRHFRATTASVLEGRWQSQDFIGRQLRGGTLGVLGMGRLGRMTANFGRSFGMHVLGCDQRPFEAEGVERVDFETMLSASDAVSIHIHMTPDNFMLFDASTFARMKPGAVLVNTSRGDIVDEGALLAALESHRLAAYGTDVLHNEWRENMRTSPLVEYARTHSNVVITPHIGGLTHQSVIGAREFSARKLVHYLKTGQELEMP